MKTSELEPSVRDVVTPTVPERAATSIPEFTSMEEQAAVATATSGVDAATEGAKSKSSADAKNDARRELILNGPIARGVFAIALPSVGAMMLQTVNSMLDRSFVGRLGPEALAATTTGSSLMFALMAAATAVSVGTTALVARFVGENNMKDATVVLRQSLLLALALSVAVGVPMYFGRDLLLTLLGMHGEAHVLAARYLAVTVLGLPFLFLMMMMNGAFRGLGDTVRPFWVTVGAIAVHASFNYLLIFGNFGFPRMGLPGGALALALSQAMSTLLYIVFLRKTPLAAVWRGYPAGERQGDTPPALWWFNREWTTRIGRIGLPAAAQQFIRVGSMLGFQSILARGVDGSAAIAALGVGLVSESIAFMPGFGYSIAASAFVGQNLGARHVKRASRGAWAATYQALAVMTLMGAVFYVAASPFAHLFVPHVKGESATAAAEIDRTIRLTISYLRIAAYSEPFLALGMVLTGALQGAGETVGPTVLTVITMICLRVPLALLLLHYTKLGTSGAWLAMTISTIILGLLTVALFRRGKWRTIRV